MTRLLLTLAIMTGILAQAWGQDTVRINNTTKAVISPIPFRVGQSAVDPTTPGNGSIWYDTATNKLEARINGVTVELGAASTITGADTQVTFFDGANSPAGDAGMTYNKTTNALTVGDLAVGSGSITLAGFTLTVPGAGGTLVTTGTLAGGALAGAFTTLSASGVLTLPAGTSGAPSLNVGDPDTGLYGPAAGNLSVVINATETVRFSTAYIYGMNIGLGPAPGSPDVHIQREAAATLQLGADAATGVNQKLKAMDASAGTGGNLTLSAGNGSTAGGTVNFQTSITTTPVDVGKFDNSATAGHTRFFLYDVDNATLERVTVGAADSGGAGFKVLRIPN